MRSRLMNRLTERERMWIDVRSRPRGRPVAALWSRWRSVGFALQGLQEAWQTQPNLRIHVRVGMVAIALGIWLRLSLVEWLWVLFAVSLVIFAELMNTAIEQTVDLVVGLSPDPLARQVKDIAAGCVLVAAAIAFVIGALTFGPHFFGG